MLPANSSHWLAEWFDSVRSSLFKHAIFHHELFAAPIHFQWHCEILLISSSTPWNPILFLLLSNGVMAQYSLLALHFNDITNSTYYYCYFFHHIMNSGLFILLLFSDWTHPCSGQHSGISMLLWWRCITPTSVYTSCMENSFPRRTLKQRRGLEYRGWNSFWSFWRKQLCCN